MEDALVLAPIAFAAAALSGVVNVAGGVTMVAVLATCLPAAAVVPIHSVVQLSSQGSRTLLMFRHVSWRLFGGFTICLVAGTAAAGLVWTGGAMVWLQALIGLFILGFLVRRRMTPRARRLPLWTFCPVGLVAGFIGVFIGATGPFVAPFFMRDDMEKEVLVATETACQGFAKVLKVPLFVALGFPFAEHARLIAVLVVASVLGTVFGRWLLSRVPDRLFLRIFEVLMGGLGTLLVVVGLSGLNTA